MEGAVRRQARHRQDRGCPRPDQAVREQRRHQRHHCGAHHIDEGPEIPLCGGGSPAASAPAAVGIGELTETGDLTFTKLSRVRTHRTRDKNGQYRWYNDYQIPGRCGNQAITVRLHGNAEDRARGFNRTENVRPIPPTDPDFAGLYPRRNDSESINRNLEHTLWIGRAHSIGHARQLMNLLGYALMVNGLALHHHRRRRLRIAA